MLVFRFALVRTIRLMPRFSLLSNGVGRMGPFVSRSHPTPLE
jgi:hypothetical protein